ncbi:MAG: hypothetical protein SOT81_10210, partial [Treponema sp.]|nr:hypothetical protein [Treponema sp.]
QKENIPRPKGKYSTTKRKIFHDQKENIPRPKIVFGKQNSHSEFISESIFSQMLKQVQHDTVHFIKLSFRIYFGIYNFADAESSSA